ncbi:MAG: hypothetical protein WCI29_13175 [Actinomycetes bacterium]
MPLDPTIPNPPNPFAGLDEMVEAQRQRDLNADQRRRDAKASRTSSEFDPFDQGESSVEAQTRALRRQARLNGDPVPPLAGELRGAE